MDGTTFDASAFTAFDIGVLVIVGLSTILAFGRGFVTVALSLAAWFGALFASVFGYSLVKPYARDIISPPELADIISLVVIFIVSLYLLKLLADMIGKSVKDGPLGALDRSLGALFGLLRGMVMVAAMYLAVSVFFTARTMPEWVKDAKIRPMVAWSADMLKEFAEDILGRQDDGDAERMLRDAADGVSSQFQTEAAEEAAGAVLRRGQDLIGDLIEETQGENTKTKEESESK